MKMTWKTSESDCFLFVSAQSTPCPLFVPSTCDKLA